MKKILLFALILLLGSGVGYAQTIKIGNLEVMTEDLGQMLWDDAKKACTDLGDGWRLPILDELKILRENMDKIGGFFANPNTTRYWSSTEEEDNWAWYMDFSGAKILDPESVLYQRKDGYNPKDVDYNVRAVRDLKD
jgi:hypothetical protein